MDHRVVEKAEQLIEARLAELFDSPKHRWPYQPDERILHMMAKAAVTVYEAAAHEAQNST